MRSWFLSLFSHSVVPNSSTSWTAPHQTSLSFIISQSFAQTHAHWVDDPIQPSHPLLSLLFLPSIIPSINVFPSELALHIRWPKFWSFSISPSNEYSGLISFRIDWLPALDSPYMLFFPIPASVGFSRQEYWSGLPFPSPGDLPDPGMEPRSPTLQVEALTSAPPGKPC